MESVSVKYACDIWYIYERSNKKCQYNGYRYLRLNCFFAPVAA